MGLTESEVQSYLRQKFQGRDSFLDNIIFPIFGEERFENGFDDPVLEDDADLKDAAEKCGIKSIIRYGDIQIDLGSIHLFEITVSNRVLLKRNRVNVQRIVRRMMGTYTGAFMIFHYDDEAAWDWRFSFCCKDDKNFTEAKRYTFLLGENQPCRTAAQNFCTLAKVRGDGRVPALADIVEAFDVEAVSRDFFNQYKEHYERFVRYITGKYFKKENGKFVEKDEGTANEAMYAGFNHDDKAVRDYVKKLLGRIVFLHFLQKKGWMGAKKGWSDGDPDFLLELYHKSSEKQKGDFLDSVLEPLFSEALDTDRREQDDFFDTGVIGVGKVRIPYLNGGLFTRDKADEVKSAFPRDYFHNLLGFLSEYNFTIDENDPNDAEVGVDPEMLSRIFENLLEDNRDKGAFYTPKAVVDYMCRRSLTANLCVGQSDADCKKIEQFVQTHDAEKLTRKLASTILRKLKDVKVCDPAIGSGAFPMGMLKLIYLSRIALGDETPPSTLKKEIIENNIYGVDIEKGAVDIARLRFWLALIVDEDTPNALPNLDFKIMQGNSLLENYKGVDLSGLLLSDVAVTKRKAKQGKLELGKIAQSVSQGELAFGGDSAAEIITAKMRQYYSETNHQTKKSLMRDIGEQVNGFIKAQINNSTLNAEIDSLGPQNDKFFLWHTWFNDVFAHGGFDIVIGNPPYVIVPSVDPLKSYYDANYEVATGGKRNLYHLFFEKGISLCKQGGVLVYITPDTYFAGGDTIALREYFLKNVRIDHIVHFTEKDKVFENVTQAVAIAVMLRGVNPTSFEIRTSKGIDKIDPSMLTKETGYLFKGFNAIIAKMKMQGRTFGDVCAGFKGDVNLGIKKAFFHDERGEDMLPLIRGIQISSYVFFGSTEWCERIAESRGHTAMARVVFQEVANAGLVHRVKGTILKDVILGDSVNYVYPSVPDVTNELILAVLNSKAVNYYFKFFNQTNHVPIGEFKKIPFPDRINEYTEELTTSVKDILVRKRENIEADTSSIEARIDDIVFTLYSLSDEDRKVILASEVKESKKRKVR